MKIAFFETNENDQKFFKEALGKTNEVVFFDKPIQDENIPSISDIEILVVFIYSHVTKEVLDSFPKLRAVCTMSTGFDHIDIAEAKKREILVCNVPTYGEVSVAEHTFALILALSRRIIESYIRVKDGYFSPEGLDGFDIHGKTLGVIGVGNIGKSVIKIANGFSMNIIAFTRNPNKDLEKEYNFSFVSLEELYQKADVITLHIPYNDETHHLINSDSIAQMKDGVILINTSRGGIIDTTALLHGLKSGKVGGAGLDVCEGEPLLREEKELLSNQFNKEDLLSVLEEHMLLHYKNVVLTPHNAFNSHESLLKILTITNENILKIAEEKPQNTVD